MQDFWVRDQGMLGLVGRMSFHFGVSPSERGHILQKWRGEFKGGCCALGGSWGQGEALSLGNLRLSRKQEANPFLTELIAVQ